MNDDSLRTIPQFGRRNNVRRTYIYGEIASGRLKAVKAGRKTLITPEAEAEWRKNLPPARFGTDEDEAGKEIDEADRV